jgi:DNA-binding transcriptional LysR family regulator
MQTVAVPGRLIIDETNYAIGLAEADQGLLYGPEPAFRAALARGSLRLVLEDWASPGPGFHIYYSSRRQLPAGLRALVDLIRELQPLGL